MHPGIFAASELGNLGSSDKAIADLVAAGRLIRLRRGWFASPLANTDALRALQLGGRLGCLSGCKAHGLWVPPHSDLHVILNPGAVAQRQPDGVTFHRSLISHHQALIPLKDCLSQVLHRHGVETGLVVIESAVSLDLLHEADARAILRAAPARHQAALGRFRLGAQSGSETRLRLFLQRRNVQVQAQVEIPGVTWDTTQRLLSAELRLRRHRLPPRPI